MNDGSQQSASKNQPAWMLRMSLQKATSRRVDGVNRQQVENQAIQSKEIGMVQDTKTKIMTESSKAGKGRQMQDLLPPQSGHVSEDETLEMSGQLMSLSLQGSHHSEEKSKPAPSSLTPVSTPFNFRSMELAGLYKAPRPAELLPLLPDLRVSPARKHQAATTNLRAYGRPDEWLHPRDGPKIKSQPTYRVKRVLNLDHPSLFSSSSPSSSRHSKKNDGRFHDSISLGDMVSVTDTIQEKDEDDEDEEEYDNLQDFLRLPRRMFIQQMNSSNESIISDLGMDESLSTCVFDDDTLQPIINVPDTVAEVSSSRSRALDDLNSNAINSQSEQASIDSSVSTASRTAATKASSLSKASSASTSSSSSVQSACMKDAQNDTIPKRPLRQRSQSPTLSSRSRKSLSIRRSKVSSSSASDSINSSSSCDKSRKPSRTSPMVAPRRVARQARLPPVSPSLTSLQPCAATKFSTPSKNRGTVSVKKKASVSPKTPPSPMSHFNSSFYSLDLSLDAGVHGIQEVSDESDVSENAIVKETTVVAIEKEEEERINEELEDSFAMGEPDARSSPSRLRSALGDDSFTIHDSDENAMNGAPGHNSLHINTSSNYQDDSSSGTKQWKVQLLDEDDTLATEASNSQFVYDSSFANSEGLLQSSATSFESGRPSSSDSFASLSKPEDFLPLRPTKRAPPVRPIKSGGSRAHNRPDDWLSPGQKTRKKPSWKVKRVWDAEEFNQRSEHTASAESIDTAETKGTASKE